VGESQSTGSHSTMLGPSTSLPFFVLRSVPRGQPSIRSMVKKKEEADKIVAKCFLWSDIPFNIAENNPFYHSMFEAVGIVGPRYKGPFFIDMRGPLLQGENTDCTKRLAELRESWEIIGCIVMSDDWTDGKGRSILNFLVNVPGGQCLSNLLMHLHMLKMHNYYVIFWITSSVRYACNMLFKSLRTMLLIMSLLTSCSWRGIRPYIGLLVLPIASI
jgi:hypothetical protein